MIKTICASAAVLAILATAALGQEQSAPPQPTDRGGAVASYSCSDHIRDIDQWRRLHRTGGGSSGSHGGQRARTIDAMRSDALKACAAGRPDHGIVDIAEIRRMLGMPPDSALGVDARRAAAAEANQQAYTGPGNYPFDPPYH